MEYDQPENWIGYYKQDINFKSNNFRIANGQLSHTIWFKAFAKTCGVKTVRCSKQAEQASVIWNHETAAQKAL